MPKLIYRGRVIELWQEKIRLPNSRKITIDVIKHPGAVLVVPFLNSRQIVFIRQFRPAIKDYLYELPAGTLEKGEKPFACAQRELKEEIGYSAARLSKIGEICPVPGYSTEKIFIFKAQGLKEAKAIGDADEIIESLVFDKNDVLKLFKQGKLIDAKTISALAFCGWL